MAGLFTGNGTYVEITDNAALDLAAGGWLLQFFVYPDSSLTQNSFGYVYSHGAPGVNVSSINVIRTSPAKALRVIIDFNGGNLVDNTSATVLFVDNTWNTLVIAYNGTNIFTAIGQGTAGSVVAETLSPPSLGAIAPASVARIGTSVSGGSRNFAGRISQAFKADINITATEVSILAGQYRSPGFFPATSAWQIPLWAAPSFDQRGALTTTDVSMTYGADGPWMVVQDSTSMDEFVTLSAANRVYSYFRLG